MPWPNLWVVNTRMVFLLFGGKTKPNTRKKNLVPRMSLYLVSITGGGLVNSDSNPLFLNTLCGEINFIPLHQRFFTCTPGH